MDLIYWIWLSQKFDYSSNKAVNLLGEFSSPENIYNASKQELEQVGLLDKTDIIKLSNKDLKFSEQIIADCKTKHIDIVTYNDEIYPKRFKTIYAPPIVIYTKGDISGLDDDVCIGVVGTRKASEYGKKLTGNLCYELARAGAVIISGCAVGVDTYAHWGALKAGGKTISILGCGLDVDYPSQNYMLKEAILKKGALLSEVPPTIQPTRTIFPIRNRLISALSLGVLVTEAPFKSGSLITAEHAIEQGKDLFCVPPHDIYDANFSGVSKYLRDGAVPVFSAKDVLFEYYSEYPHKLKAEIVFKTFINKEKKYTKAKATENYKKSAKNTQEKLEKETKADEIIKKEWDNSLSLQHKKVYECLQIEPMVIDDICYYVSMELHEVLSILTELELYGYAMSFSGRRYALMNL